MGDHFISLFQKTIEAQIDSAMTGGDLASASLLVSIKKAAEECGPEMVFGTLILFLGAIQENLNNGN